MIFKEQKQNKKHTIIIHLTILAQRNLQLTKKKNIYDPFFKNRKLNTNNTPKKLDPLPKEVKKDLDSF